MKFPYTITGNTVQVFANGQMMSLSSNQPTFEALKEHLRQADHDLDTVVALIDKAKMVERKTHGKVTVVGNSVYYNGMPVRSSLTERLVNMLQDGFDPTPWMAFYDRLMKNPSERSRECLYNFLDHWKTPITEDGCFIAFKYVRQDYKDAYSGLFDNSPGQTPSVPWEEVDDDPTRTCSRGLHVCASHYLGGYSSNKRVVVVKVPPENVVSVPVDYGFAKMRTCGYEVLADAISPEEIADIENRSFYQTNADPVDAEDWSPEYDVDNYDYDAYLDDEDEFDYLYDYDEDYEYEYNDDDDDDDDDDLVFEDANENRWSARYIVGQVDEYGQRQFSRDSGIPRSTLQEWLKKAREYLSR